MDISSYIAYFRRFHIFLGVSFLVLETVLTYLINENAGGIFLAVYPILAYLYFISTSSKYFKGVSATWNKVGIYVLVGTLLFVVGLLGYGFRENKLTFDSDHIEIKGSYGETLTQAEIKSAELVDQLPEITLKTNGFALGTINKGYFQNR